LVHSSTLVTAGVYLLIRFNKVLLFRGVDKVLFYISILTIFISGFIANFEVDLKKIIALSTLRQLGLIIIILRLGLKILAFYHLLTHAVFKSLLFICAGVMIHLIDNNQDIRLRGKLNEFIPFTIIRFYISSLALMGFPFLAGFYSKDLIIEVIYIYKVNFFII
jgi:NADH-ubiquinone oxidoreductase chain 5